MFMFFIRSFSLQYHIERISIFTGKSKPRIVPKVLPWFEGDLYGHGIECIDACIGSCRVFKPLLQSVFHGQRGVTESSGTRTALTPPWRKGVFMPRGFWQPLLYHRMVYESIDVFGWRSHSTHNRDRRTSYQPWPRGNIEYVRVVCFGTPLVVASYLDCTDAFGRFYGNTLRW